MLIFYLLYLLFPAAPTSCAEARSSTVRLANPDPETRIFSVEILDSTFRADAQFPDLHAVPVRVTETFVGSEPAQSLSLSWAGSLPQKGETWLVFASWEHGKYLTGGLCSETTRLNDSAYDRFLLQRLRHFRAARQARRLRQLELRHFESGRLAARGAFLRGLPVGDWVHYFPNGSRRAQFRFDKAGRQHGWNEDFAHQPGMSRIHYTHGVADTSWYFRDTLGTQIDATVFRSRTGAVQQLYRYQYNFSNQIQYVEYTEYADSASAGSPRPYRFSVTKTFSPAVAGDSLYQYDRARARWQSLPVKKQ
ncbi:MAG: hypothetical protein IT260_15485 [Saprospiraceae bacterium]|nr:hypothetical protein [Saprospiraceae bacterium]